VSSAKERGGLSYIHRRVPRLCTFIGKTERIYYRLEGTRLVPREVCVLSATVKARNSVKKTGGVFHRRAPSSSTHSEIPRCKKCKGAKTVKEKTRQELLIERGMANQQRIVLAGAGDEEPGIPPGDVVFVLKQTPHDSFQRSGNDLLTAVHITLSEALFGFSRILVTHLDGRGIHVSSPPGKIIKPGESIVARGEGMPTYKHPDTKGDLYIVCRIDMPGEEWLNTVDRAVRPTIFQPYSSSHHPH